MSKSLKKSFKFDITFDRGQTTKPHTLQGKFDQKTLNLTYNRHGKSINWEIDLSHFKFSHPPSKHGRDFSDFKLTHKPTPAFSQLLVFGDSLSDTGNLFKLTGQIFPPSPPYFEGRLSNGPIWVDFIAPKLGLSDDRVKSFAVSGATTGRDNIENARRGTTGFPGLLNELDAFTTAPGFSGFDPKALYVVWAGGNDFLQIAETPQEAPKVITQAVTNLATAITTLASGGAKQIVVPNQINFGLTPFARERGLSSVATEATIGFNQALAQGLVQLEKTLNIDLIEVDMFSVVERIAAAPGEFGFSNVSKALIRETNPVNPASYFWWDDVHPTTQTHKIYAETIQTAVSNSGVRRCEAALYPCNSFEPKITLATNCPLKV
jgi:phospholipase/lecithinase/hemolysin